MPHFLLPTLLPTLTLLFTLLVPAMQAQPTAHDLNALILSEIANMPKGGGYAVTAHRAQGITVDTAAAYAASGVDLLSTSQITQSAPALDLGLDIE